MNINGTSTNRLVIQVDDGLIYAHDNGEWGAEVIWKSSQPQQRQSLLRKIFTNITKKPTQDKTEPKRTSQIISNDHITGFLNTRYGILGFGGFQHLSLDEGYVIKFFKENDSWKSKHIIHTKNRITSLKECNDGLLLCQKSNWIHYSCNDLLINNFNKYNLFSFYTPGDVQNIITTQIPKIKFICSRCDKLINDKDYLVKCGPCGNLFCRSCWNEHQWCHGKSPAVGIEYHQDGSFSGFDGSDRLK